MKRFMEVADRGQSTLLPECLDDRVDESNPVRAVDAVVDALKLAELGFQDVEPAITGRPGYHPAALLKLYIYGYLNRIQSSRRLEREARRNLEVIWLLRRLAPDDKTIADFRRDNGPAIKKVCAKFVDLCRQMGLLTKASIAIDGSKFKAVLGVDKLEAVADRGDYSGEEIKACEDADIAVTLPKPLTSGMEANGKFGKGDFVHLAAVDADRCPTGETLIYHSATVDAGRAIRRYYTNACKTCSLKPRCTRAKNRVISRWEHEHVMEAAQKRLDADPQAMRRRRETVEHPFGTLKMRMGATHFLMKRLPKVATEMALHVLAYHLTRVMNIMGVKTLIAAMKA